MSLTTSDFVCVRLSSSDGTSGLHWSGPSLVYVWAGTRLLSSVAELKLTKTECVARLYGLKGTGHGRESGPRGVGVPRPTLPWVEQGCVPPGQAPAPLQS